VRRIAGDAAVLWCDGHKRAPSPHKDSVFSRIFAILNVLDGPEIHFVSADDKV
jgi:prepilin-type processing-associated H-X9-DG protein